MVSGAGGGGGGGGNVGVGGVGPIGYTGTGGVIGGSNTLPAYGGGTAGAGYVPPK